MDTEIAVKHDSEAVRRLYEENAHLKKSLELEKEKHQEDHMKMIALGEDLDFQKSIVRALIRAINVMEGWAE